MSKPIVFYDPSHGVYRVENTQVLLRPIGHAEDGTTHIIEEFLTWNKATGVIETRDTIYKPKENDSAN